MSWGDLFDSFASLFEDRPSTTSYNVSRRAVFQQWMNAIADHFKAALEFDEDGDGRMMLQIRGEARGAIVVLKGDIITTLAPSERRFPLGRCPRNVAEFLRERNQKLDYADWDIIDGRDYSYFALKSHGNMDRISKESLQTVLEKMLSESYALDQALVEQGC